MEFQEIVVACPETTGFGLAEMETVQELRIQLFVPSFAIDVARVYPGAQSNSHFLSLATQEETRVEGVFAVNPTLSSKQMFALGMVNGLQLL